ncbi:acetylornithine transaminase [Sulfuriflexus mobilis]|uniref:acetylornithine transaminase n=1 Tax=Sulfuriflexus mobilis TaxID=1811807 RepID=UPI000F845E7C|nr:acetylornithine transaminase [Sulfuriflexus mobilis]
MMDALMNTYTRLPVNFTRGEGAWLWDSEGNKYLDALGGIAVCGLGHAHPAVTKAICDQAATLVHTSNLYGIEVQGLLAEKLTTLSGLQRAFFSNSGAEANEAAIKIARLYGHKKGIAQPNIIVADGSFHGRTMATLSATGNRKVQAGFEPLVQGFIRVPYNDLGAIRNVARNTDGVVAVLVEPIQGEGGINIPAADYLNGLRAICDENDWLLMLDEIQTGMGRSGKWFAFQHNGIQPDVMTLAKALGNGVPIGACLAGGKAAEVFQPGNHGSTFGGNPLACRAALAVIDSIEQQGLIERANVLSQKFLDGFKARLGDNAHVVDIRAQGLLLGIELDSPCAALVGEALANGLLINVTADKVIRLLPPLIISDAEADMIIDKVSSLVEAFVAEQATSAAV